ncbi:MAG: Ldh family oxidoreductase [Pseudomonadota bacterium]
MAELVSITLKEAGELVEAALVAANTSPENAKITARALVRAEADGQGGHGLSRVPSYVEQARSGKVDGHAEPQMEILRPGLIRIDAGHGFAYPAIAKAIPQLLIRVNSCGVAAASIHRSHHFGVAGHHCEDLANRGYIGFVYGNAPKAMAPWGATQPVLGTNPIAFAAPLPDGPPLVIDMALTTVARGKILAAREVGADIPEGWALGPDGAPTTDPATALKGSMAPIGGAKGAALALMVEVMSAALAGAAFGTEASSLFDPDGLPPNLGQSILAIDADTMSGGTFLSRMADLAATYEDLDGVRLPGARRIDLRAQANAEGLRIDAGLLERIRELAAA